MRYFHRTSVEKCDFVDWLPTSQRAPSRIPEFPREIQIRFCVMCPDESHDQNFELEVQREFLIATTQMAKCSKTDTFIIQRFQTDDVFVASSVAQRGCLIEMEQYKESISTLRNTSVFLSPFVFGYQSFLPSNLHDKTVDYRSLLCKMVDAYILLFLFCPPRVH